MTDATARDEPSALRMDELDPLTGCRDLFHVPRRADGSPVIYFCGNSLGLQPRAARHLVEKDLDDWAEFAVDAHFKAATPWYSYHEVFREAGARLVGARPGEVVMMNGLTVNLHLMMATFYRPTRERHAILIEADAFPSDHYAVASQIRHHGFDPADSLIVAGPANGETTIAAERFEEILAQRGKEIALVLLPGVQYLTGQVFDVARIAAAAHRHGCRIGLDLAHAAGNVTLALHDWQIDFAVWCSYKYLNSGPGGIAGCFVHEKHGRDRSLPRFAGWWGNDPKSRFEMRREFEPQNEAAGWQIGNPPILAMAPLRASLQIFDDAGMSTLRARSIRMIGYLESLIDALPGGCVEIITPRATAERGCQLSLRVPRNPPALLAALAAEGVVCDFRAPDVIRVAPVPLYNTFHEMWRFARILGSVSGDDGGGAR
jgi:kynureninase